MAVDAGVVLDSSALLALLLREPGAGAVEARLGSAVICSVNLGETLTKLMRRGAAPERAEGLLRELNLEVIAWTAGLVWQGRDLCPLAWTHGLSLGDRACLATARALGRTALTGDAAWAEAVRGLRPPVRVELIHPPRSTGRALAPK